MADRQVVIIGSGPAGLTAALYTARANLKPLLIEGLEAGGQLMLTTMVENWPGFRDGIMGPDLMAEMRAQAERFGTEILQGNVHERRPAASGRSRSRWPTARAITADALIIATGASARWLEIGSDRKLSGHGVSTCATCDGYFFRGKPIAVVGGGDSAMEEAIYLTRFASKVTVIHRRDYAARVEDHAGQGVREPEDRVHLGLGDRRGQGRRQGRGHRHRRAQPEDRRSSRELPLDGVFIAIGHTPNTSLFKGQIELDDNGYIVTHDGHAGRACPACSPPATCRTTSTGRR